MKYSLAVLAGIFFVYLAFNFNAPFWVAFDGEIRALLKDNELIIIFHYLGESVVSAAVGIILVLFFVIRGKDYRAMLFVVLVLAGGNGLNKFLKQVVQRPRPEIVDQLTSYSFPSGHTMAGFFTLMTAAYFLTRGTRVTKRMFIVWLVALLLALLVGLARIAEGRHFATDVLAGWCIGYVWFIGCVWWYERREKSIRKRYE